MDRPDNIADSLFASVILAKDNRSPTDTEDAKRWAQSDDIDTSRWNQAFPYQLLVVKKSNGAYVPQDKWRFTLPIPPESIDYSMAPAVGMQATLDGVILEYGGTPFRSISLNGTMGVMPLRGRADQSEHSPLVGAVFAGSLQGVNKMTQSALSLAGLGLHENLISEFLPAFSDTMMTTGYRQFRLLKKFLEDYNAIKKTSAGKDLRLAFCMWKDEAVYLIEINRCNFRKSKDSPLEYTYQMSMQAYARINLNATPEPFDGFRSAVRDPNLLAQMLNAINDARGILEGARETILAVRGDVDHALFEPVRSVVLFIKDALGVPMALADLPNNLIQDCKTAVIQYIGLKSALEGFGNVMDQRFKSVAQKANALAVYAGTTGKIDTEGGDLVPGNGVDPLRSYSSSDPNDPALDVFTDPSKHYDFFSQLKPSQLPISPQLAKKVLGERKKAGQKSRLDFERDRDQVEQVLADFEDAVGVGNSTFTSTYGRPTITAKREATDDDYRAIYAMNRLITQLNKLAVSGHTNRFTTNSIDTMAALARRSGIAFKTPRSKFAVPFPYGYTMERLAARYLGNPDRWIEIVPLNGLRAPYVDEVGFDLTLLTPGKGNEVMVSDASDLYLGQTIWLSASGTARAQRHITKITKIGANYVITVDGDPDMDRYTTGALLHAFLPDTINSMQMVYIPSDKDPGFSDNLTKSVPGIDEFDPLIDVCGYDILLSESTNDIVITPDGDQRLAVGLACAIQEARIGMSTFQGTLLYHPSFGLKVKVGMSVADLDPKDLIQSIRDVFAQNPTFTGVRSSFVSVSGPAVFITATVGIRGHSQYIPLTFRAPSGGGAATV